MQEIFYHPVIASSLFFSEVCWVGSISACDTHRLCKLIKLLSFTDNQGRVLHHTLVRQWMSSPRDWDSCVV